jgi:hypothetical protein
VKTRLITICVFGSFQHQGWPEQFDVLPLEKEYARSITHSRECCSRSCSARRNIPARCGSATLEEEGKP